MTLCSNWATRFTLAATLPLVWTALDGRLSPAATVGTAAYVTATDHRVALGNQFLERGLDLSGGTVRTAYLENKLTKKRMPVDSREFIIRIDKDTELSERDFRIVSGPTTIDLPDGGRRLVCQLSHQKPDLTVKVVYELLADDFYTRKWLEISPPPTPHLLKTIDIERLRVDGASLLLAGPEPKDQDWLQKLYTPLTTRLGQPVFADNFFLGVEYPATENSIDSAGWIALRQYFGRKMDQKPLESKKSVIGVAPGTPLNRVGDWFQRYIDRIRIAPVRRFIHWESWWSTKRPTEEKVLMMIDGVKREFLDKGIPLNAYLFSAHWQTDGWKLNRKAFPNGLGPIKKRLDEVGLPMGFWMGLTQGGGTPEWFKSHGYEQTETGHPCFAAPKWGDRITKIFLGLVKDCGMVCWKNDYTVYTCETTGHGHLGGLYSVAAHTDAMIDLLRRTRHIKPDFYAYDASWVSPWWLMHFNAVWPDLTDYYLDYGFPCSNVRDNQITSRDAHIYRRFVTDRFQVPLHSIMTSEPIRAMPLEDFQNLRGPQPPPNVETPFFGNEDPLDRWTNNIVMHYCRGTSLTELYVSPWLLGDGYGDNLRSVMKWGIEHTDVLLPATRIILGDPRRLQVYGYAHFPQDLHRGIIGLRNPAFARQSAWIALDESAGLAQSPDEYVVEIVYPYRKTLGRTFRYGDKIECSLEGYEAAVLEVTAVAHLTRPAILGAQYRPVERSPGKLACDLLGLPGSEPSCRVVWPTGGVTASLDGNDAPLGESGQLAPEFPGQQKQLVATRSASPNELLVEVPEGYCNPTIVVLCRGNGAEKLQYTMTNNGQPMALRAVKPNRYAGYMKAGQGWQFFVGPLAVGQNRLHYTLPSAGAKIDLRANISAEAPLAKRRLELSFSGGQPAEKNRALPLLYGNHQRQVAEVDLTNRGK
jgi:hypothetical protein